MGSSQRDETEESQFAGLLVLRVLVIPEREREPVRDDGDSGRLSMTHRTERSHQNFRLDLKLGHGGWMER